MKVRIERTFPLPAPPEAAWAVLADIASVATCMPGAKITEKVDDAHYKGTVSVRLGPANLSFRGVIDVKSCDPATRTLQLSAKGTDTTGASVASMELTARIEPAADGTSALVGISEAAIGGKAAAFGNRMMDAVSDQILKQFAANFAAKVAERAAAAQANAASAISAAAGAGTPSRAAAGGVAPGGPPAEGGSSATPGAATPVAVDAEAPALNGLALLWAIIRDWFRGLFTRRAR